MENWDFDKLAKLVEQAISDTTEAIEQAIDEREEREREEREREEREREEREYRERLIEHYKQRHENNVLAFYVTNDAGGDRLAGRAEWKLSDVVHGAFGENTAIVRCVAPMLLIESGEPFRLCFHGRTFGDGGEFHVCSYNLNLSGACIAGATISWQIVCPLMALKNEQSVHLLDHGQPKCNHLDCIGQAKKAPSW